MKRLILTLASALLLMLALASTASAQDDPDPPCDPATTPGLTFDQDLPGTLIDRRDYRFGLGATGEAYVSPYIDVIVNGQTGDAQDLMDGKTPFHVKATGSPVTLTATYEEQSDTGWCIRTLTVTKDLTRGVKMPRPKIGKDWFRVARYGDGCADKYAVAPLLLSVRPKGAHRWYKATAADQCHGWDKTVNGPGFKLDASDPNRYLGFVSKSNRTGTKDFAFRLAESGKRIATGTITVVTKHRAARRVYALNGNQTNDEYWNYCVNEGKQTWMDHGNPYCWKPSRTRHSVFTRRK